MTLGDLIGLIGVGLTLLAYFLLNIRKISSETLTFPLLNSIGSILIIYSLICDWSLAAFVMEISWLLISLYGVYQTWRK